LRKGSGRGNALRPGPSARAAGVAIPIIPTVAGWTAETPGTISLGQGVVHFGPPRSALEAIPASRGFTHTDTSPTPVFRAAKGVRGEADTVNGIDAPHERRIFVTAGAKPGFLNAILSSATPATR
jgi:aspartate/methionine/tyrosine aminotransferase